MSTLESPLLPAAAHEELFAPGAFRELLEGQLLPAYMPRCRWFAGKARDPRRFEVRDVAALSHEPEAARFLLVEVTYAEGAPEMYLLPLQVLRGEAARAVAEGHPHAVVAHGEDAILCDAIHDEAFRGALFALIASNGACMGEHGAFSGESGPALAGVKGLPTSRPLAVEQSNSSVVYGEQIFLKLYRRLENGMNPDAEILRFLSSRGFPYAPPFAGAVEYRDSLGRSCVLALATAHVRNRGDAWAFMLGELQRWLGALAPGDDRAEPIVTELLARVKQLGARTGELHLALAMETIDPDFAAEPLTAADGQALAAGIEATARQILGLIQARRATLPEPARALAERLVALEAALRTRLSSLARPVGAAKTRTHGDYHLGQVLETGGDFVIIDFEGEPLRPLATRREKRSPFRDVAGMLRSFDYAAHSALEALPGASSEQAARAALWSAQAQNLFLQAWQTTTAGACFRAATVAEESRLLEGFLLEKALYEVVYEISNRPAWLPIPLRGVLQLLESALTSPA